ncbi:hypothetical protein [Cerasicoccus maritimus]|uniref:hypothetical protein n=1 Tax=Cerasicoccus maritimus TaxID=490089 RepID=UPI0028528B80|nr:hypothetical protein [Cerasicoccus maritimus]
MRYLAIIWGLGGVFLFIGSAVYRLTPNALEAMQGELTSMQWAVAIVWTLFMLVSEGYRGFQKQFSPRVVARSKYLSANPKPVHVLFAPFFCMAFFHATKKRKIVTWCLTLGIVMLIVLVRQLEQPWRGIVDLGVVLGLVYGLVWIAIFAVQCYSGRKFDVDPEVS